MQQSKDEQMDIQQLHLQNIKEINQFINLGNKALKDVNKNHTIILLIGATGSGKSTTANFLVGCKMINHLYINKTFDKDLQKTFTKKKFVVSAEEQIFEIGNKQTSQTSFIQVSKMKSNNDCLVCDCPGFFDNRGVEIEIAHSVCLEIFLQKCQIVIPIVLIPYINIIQPRGDQLNSQLQIIIDSLANQSFENFSKILFLYTHVTKGVTTLEIRQRFEDAIVDKVEDTSNKAKNLIQKKLLSVLIQQIDEYSDILILDPIQKNREDYLKLINKQQPFLNPKEDFCISLSDNSQKSMQLYIQSAKIQINDLLIKNNYIEIVDVILTLKELVDCLQQSKFLYLINEYQECQKLVDDNITSKYNEAIETIKKSNQQDVIITIENIEKINLLLQYLTIIDQHKQFIFTEFQISKTLFEEDIKKVCNEIKQSAINNLSSDFKNLSLEARQSEINNISVDFEKTKINMQNLLSISNQVNEIKEINSIFNECKQQVFDVFNEQYEELKEKLKLFFCSRSDVNRDIDEIVSKFIKFQSSENCLKSFFETNEQLNFYKRIIEKATTYNKQNLDYIQKFTKRYKNKLFITQKYCLNDQTNISTETSLNSSLQNGCISQVQEQQDYNKDIIIINQNSFIDEGKDYERLPQFEIELFKHLDSHQGFKYHVQEFQKDYSSVINILRQFLQKSYQSLIQNSQSKKKAKQIEQEINFLESIRKIDQEFFKNTLPSYSQFQIDLIKGIDQNWKSIKNNLKKYNESNNEVDLGEQDTLDNTIIRKIHKVYQYYNDMLWIDSYFKLEKVNNTIEKIKQSLKNYFEFLQKKSKEFALNKQSENLNMFLKKINSLNIVKDAIPNYEEDNSKSFDIIKQVIMNEVGEIEQEFLEQEKAFQDQESLNLDLIKLNNGLSKLSQIKNKLKDVPEFYSKSEKLIQEIYNLVKQYFKKNHNFILQNQDYYDIKRLIKNDKLKKQTDFLYNLKNMHSKYHEISNCFEDYQDYKEKGEKQAFHLIDTIFEKLVDYYEMQTKNENLNDKIEIYNIIKTYCNVFKKGYKKIYENFQNLTDPKLIIQQGVQNILNQIIQQDYQEILNSFLKLKDVKQAEGDVQNGLTFIYNKIQKNFVDLKSIINDLLNNEYQLIQNYNFQEQFTKLVEQIQQISLIFQELEKKDEIKNIESLKQEVQKLICDSIISKIQYLIDLAKIQSFTRMESAFKTLDQLLIEIRKSQYFIKYLINWRLRLYDPIEQLYKNVEFTFQQNVDFLIKLKKLIENDQNSPFLQTYNTMKNLTQNRLSISLINDFKQIKNSVNSKELTKANYDFKQIKSRIFELEKQQLYFEQQIPIQELEDQLSMLINIKVNQLDKSIQKKDFNETVLLLKEFYKNDKSCYNQKFLQLKEQQQKNFKIIGQEYIKLSYEDFTQKLQKLIFLEKVTDQFPLEAQHQERIEELKKNLFEKSEQILNDLERFLKNEDKIDASKDFEIIDLFKLQKYLEKIQENDNNAGDIQFHNLFKKIIFLKKLLDDTLNSHFNDQQQLINIIEQKQIIKELNQFYQRIMLFSKQMDHFKKCSDKQKYQEFDGEKVCKLLQNLQYSSQLDQAILKKFESYEDTLMEALNKFNFSVVKDLILFLNQMSSFNQNYQKNFKNITIKIQNFINEMTKKAQQQIINESYDLQLNQFINNIYSAEENLNDINHFNYSTQSQIKLINDQITKNLQEIIIQSLNNFGGDHIKMSESILIQLQKIADKVSKFSSIIKNKQEKYLEGFLKKYQQTGVIRLGQILNQDATGKFIVHEMKIFKMLIIENFNKNAATHKFSDILKNIQFPENIQFYENQKELITQKKDEISCLEGYYLIYENIYQQQIQSYLKSGNKQGIIDNVNSIISSNKISIQNWNDNTKKLIAIILANICSYWTIEKSAELIKNESKFWYTPTHTQILSVMMLLGLEMDQDYFQKCGSLFKLYTPFENKIIEILTGEGKSLVLALSSILFAKIGCSVDVACYSKYLSQHNYQDFSQIFKDFGVSDNIKYGNLDELVENQLKIFEDIKDLTNNALQSKFNCQPQQKQQNQQHIVPKILLVDEVDIFFDQKFYGKTYNQITYKSSQEIQNIIQQVWNNKEKTPSEIQKNIFQTDDYQKLIQDNPGLKQYIDNQITLLSTQVQTFEQNFERVQSFEQIQPFDNQKIYYIVKNNQISYKKLDNSDCFNSSYGYNTLFIYFKLQQQGEISQQTLNQYLAFIVNCGKLCYALIPNIYQNILGVTGTLRYLNPQMKQTLKMYKINKEIHVPSIYNKSNLDFKEIDYVIVEENINEQYLQINKITQQAYQNQQPVLIFFKNQIEISQFLENKIHIISPNQYNLIVEDTPNINNQVNSTTQIQSISLCVRQYGRGVNFVCYDNEVEEKGGVVVIQTFLSEDKTEEIQIQGRTARQSQKGQYYLILNKQDLTKTFQVSSQQIEQWKKDQSVQTLYYHLAQIRDKYWEDNYKENSQNINDSNNLHLETLQYQINLKKGEKMEIYNFLNKNG